MGELDNDWDVAAVKIDRDPMRPIRYGMAARYIKDLDKNQELLEVGCGEGTGLSIFARMGFTRLTGVEVSAERLRRAYDKVPSGTLLHEINPDSALPFNDGSFGLVISLAVIEHVISPKQYLAEICRVLKPCGTAIISSDCLSWNYMQRLHLYRSMQPIDWALEIGTFENLFEETGFRMQHFDTFNLPGRGCPMYSSIKNILGKSLLGRDLNKCLERNDNTNNLDSSIQEALKVSQGKIDNSKFYLFKKRIRNLIDDENVFFLSKNA